MTGKIVGVISSRADLQRALRMRRAPDLFELRLDCLVSCLDELRNVIAHLPTPFIITARDPREGGANNLSPARRRALLLEFLPHARYVDVELRSAPAFRRVLQSAAEHNAAAIISFHDLRSTPSPATLDQLAARAQSLGAAIVKVATRTDTSAQLAALLDFFDRHRRQAKMAAMGIGRLGRTARRELARRGSVLNYGHLGAAVAPGQLSVPELRRLIE